MKIKHANIEATLTAVNAQANTIDFVRAGQAYHNVPVEGALPELKLLSVFTTDVDGNVSFATKVKEKAAKGAKKEVGSGCAYKAKY